MQDLERILMEQERDIEALSEKRQRAPDHQPQALEDPGGALLRDLQRAVRLGAGVPKVPEAQEVGVPGWAPGGHQDPGRGARHEHGGEDEAGRQVRR